MDATVKYGVVLADPPWRYSFSKSKSRRIENQYPTMSLQEIAALPVSDIAAKDAMLFLWTTTAKLKETFTVIESWGFEYVTSAVWDKEVMGMGYYFRGQHEFLLVCKRGKPRAPAPNTRPSSVIRSRRGRHSAKPASVYQIIETMYPEIPKVELFARNTREGWDRWGNEVLSTVQLEREVCGQ